jgi:hypothetical protein
VARLVGRARLAGEQVGREHSLGAQQLRRGGVEVASPGCYAHETTGLKSANVPAGLDSHSQAWTWKKAGTW